MATPDAPAWVKHRAPNRQSTGSGGRSAGPISSSPLLHEAIPAVTPAPIPARDETRLQALRELLLLDTPPEARFDRIVQFAAAQFEMPIVLVTLVDRERQWFKASVGINVCETAREISFCGHAITEPELFIVTDARHDPRFADNPLVTGAPYLRFYAGAPLGLPNGEAVGTLCLIDVAPRGFDDVDRAMLSSLRSLVVEELIRRPGARA
jgi:GAF domain-containing protein